MKMLIALLVVFAIGVAMGTYASSKRAARGAHALAELQAFQTCATALRTNAYMHKLRFDAASKARFIDVYIHQTYCLHQGYYLSGLWLGDVACASGFRYWETKKEYRKGFGRGLHLSDIALRRMERMARPVGNTCV